MFLEISFGFLIASIICCYVYAYNPRRPPPVRYYHGAMPAVPVIGHCEVCDLNNCISLNCNIIRDLDPSTMDTTIVINFHGDVKQELIDYVTDIHGLECYVGKHRARIALYPDNCLIIRPPTGSMTKYAGKE